MSQGNCCAKSVCFKVSVVALALFICKQILHENSESKHMIESAMKHRAETQQLELNFREIENDVKYVTRIQESEHSVATENDAEVARIQDIEHAVVPPDKEPAKTRVRQFGSVPKVIILCSLLRLATKYRRTTTS